MECKAIILSSFSNRTIRCVWVNSNEFRFAKSASDHLFLGITIWATSIYYKVRNSLIVNFIIQQSAIQVWSIVYAEVKFISFLTRNWINFRLNAEWLWNILNLNKFKECWQFGLREILCVHQNQMPSNSIAYYYAHFWHLIFPEILVFTLTLQWLAWFKLQTLVKKE